MNEKIYQYLMYLILLAIIFFTFLSINTKISENRIIKEKSLARDLALTYDLILSSPNNLKAELEIDESYTIAIDDSCKLQIKKEAETPTTYYCGKDKITSKIIQIDKNKLIKK